MEETKSKDKGKTKMGPLEKGDHNTSASPTRQAKGKQRVREPLSLEGPSGSKEVVGQLAGISASQIHAHQKRLPVSVDSSHADPPYETSSRKKRKVAILEHDRPPDVMPELDIPSLTASLMQPKVLTSLKHPSNRHNKTRPIHLEIPHTVPTPSSVIESYKPPSKPPLTIRRVKLIVRRPPPALSHPNQRPSGPKFGESLSSLLTSYINHDSKELSANPLPDEIIQSAQAQATFWTRVDTLKRAGKLFYIPDSDGLDPSGRLASHGDIRRDPDVWDFVLDEMIAYGKVRTRSPSGVQVAAQIAARVRAYWDAMSLKEDKMRVQEEQKRRVMARKLARDVTSAWSKALAVRCSLKNWINTNVPDSILGTRRGWPTRLRKEDGGTNILMTY